MRILFITSSYPSAPGTGGGYSQLCEEVAEGLYARGYEIAIFTSKSQQTALPRNYPVWRTFKPDPDWNGPFPVYFQFYFGRVKRENQTLMELQKTIKTFAPHLVFVWHVAGIERGIFRWLETSSGSPIVYYLADYAVENRDEYYTYWKAPAEKNIKSIPKRIVAMRALATLEKDGRPIHLKHEHVICVSSFLRDRLVSKQIIPETATVIHNGIDLECFEPNNQNHILDKLDCVILGRLVPEKGISTVIKAFSLLAKPNDLSRLKLTIWGDGPSDYVSSLKTMIDFYGLQNVISLNSSVNRNQVPNILRKHNTFIFASEWDEPLARSVQEAMAMKLLVIGTNTGGTGELLIHGKTGLVFRAGDAEDLAARLTYALSNSDVMTELAEAGYDVVRQSFNITFTINRIEFYLRGLISKSVQSGHRQRLIQLAGK